MTFTTSESEQLPTEQSKSPVTATTSTSTLVPLTTPQPGAGFPRRYRRTILLSLVLLVLCLLLVGGVTSMLGQGLAFFSPHATITISPRFAVEQQSIGVTAVTGTPQGTQAQARQLTIHSVTQRVTVPATGNGHLPARSARGQITFYNLATYGISIPAGVRLIGRSGVAVVTDASVYVPAGNPPALGSASVPAHTSMTGSDVNSAAGDINALCCASGIVAKNQQSFSGGRDARSFKVVQQLDITEAATPLVSSLSQQVQASLAGDLRPGERATSPQCIPHIQPDHQVGQEADQVHVSVSVTCTRLAYISQQVVSRASLLYQQQLGAALGPDYALEGSLLASPEQITADNTKTGTLSISVPIRGVWVYRVERSAFPLLLKRIAGTDPARARTILMTVPGVSSVSILLSGWNTTTLPTGSDQISIVVATPR
jgi:hypothetical protein